MGAKNKVIAGDYTGHQVTAGFGIVMIVNGWSDDIVLNKTTVSSYELITEETRKSAASGISRGLVGGALLGPVGLLAGLSAKNKGVYQVAILFENGEKSLIEVDDKIYKALIKALF